MIHTCKSINRLTALIVMQVRATVTQLNQPAGNHSCSLTLSNNKAKNNMHGHLNQWSTSLMCFTYHAKGTHTHMAGTAGAALTRPLLSTCTQSTYLSVLKCYQQSISNFNKVLLPPPVALTMAWCPCKHTHHNTDTLTTVHRSVPRCAAKYNRGLRNQ